jgi:hypothetical protein
MTTTFIPGNPPAMMVGSLFIWPGLFDQKNRSDGDLIQTVAEFTDQPKMVQTCSAGAGQWQALAASKELLKDCSLTVEQVYSSFRSSRILHIPDSSERQTNRRERSNQD